MNPDRLSVSVRILAFVALFQATGAAFFLAIFGRPLTLAWAPVRRLGCISALAGLVLILLHLTLDAARLSGDYDGLRDLDLQRLAWTSTTGISQLIQAGGLLAIHIALRHRGQDWGRVTWASLAGVFVCLGFLLTGHTSHHASRGVLAPLLALHLLVAAFWFGSLLPLILVIRLESTETAAGLLGRFSSLAAWVVPLILVAGMVIAWMLAGTFKVLQRPYGELLLAKLAGFALLMLFAAYNKWRLTPALTNGGSAGALSWSIAAEYALVVAVLSVTAVLTTFYSPE